MGHINFQLATTEWKSCFTIKGAEPLGVTIQVLNDQRSRCFNSFRSIETLGHDDGPKLGYCHDPQTNSLRYDGASLANSRVY